MTYVMISIALTACIYAYVVSRAFMAMTSVVEEKKIVINHLELHIDHLEKVISHAKSELISLHFAHKNGQDVPMLIGSISDRMMQREFDLKAPYIKPDQIISKYKGGKLNY